MSTITDTTATTAVSNDTGSTLPADPRLRFVSLMDLVVAAAAAFEDWAEDTVRVTMHDIAVSPSRLLHAVRAAICTDLDSLNLGIFTQLESVAELMACLAGELVETCHDMRVPAHRPGVDMEGCQHGDPVPWDTCSIDADQNSIKQDIAYRLLRMVRCGIPEVTGEALSDTEIRQIYGGFWHVFWLPDNEVDIAGRVSAVVHADYLRIMRTCMATGQDLNWDHFVTEFSRSMLDKTPRVVEFVPLLYVDDIWDHAWDALTDEQRREFYKASYLFSPRQYKNDASIAVDLHDWVDEAPLTTTPDMLAAWQAVDTRHIQDSLNPKGHSND